MAAGSEFSFIAPRRLGRRVDPRNQVHQFGQSRHRVLQAQVHAPQHAGVGFVTQSRRLGRRALALVKGGNTEHGSRAHAVQIQREFGAGAKQQLVVDFKQRFAFVSDLDFFIRVKGALTQKFNLAQFIVHFVVGSTDKGRRTRRHLFCTRRNIHTGTTAHGIAGTGVTDTQGRAAALTHRFEIETVRVARKVVNRERIELRHSRRRIQVTQWFQAVLLGQLVFVFVGFIGIDSIVS